MTEKALSTLFREAYGEAGIAFLIAALEYHSAPHVIERLKRQALKEIEINQQTIK